MAADRAIVIAGGGTGGHVFPGLAVADELRRRHPHWPLLWIGASGGVEERLVPRAQIALSVLPMAGLAGQGLARGLRASWLAASATVRLLLRFIRRRPLVLVGVGGFASGPAVLAALLLGVPTLLLEQNAIPGRTTRALARFASAVAVSFPASGDLLRGRTVLTGNPVRTEIASVPERGDRPVRRVLSFGGSRGAQALNEAWIAALGALARLPLVFTLQTGEEDLARVREAARAAREAGPAVSEKARATAHVEVLAFLDDMPRRLAEADVVVARAGATTVAELTAAGRASILVPYPFAADDHQRANARALADGGAAVVIDPDELSGERLREEIERLAHDPKRVSAIGTAARRLGRPDAARRVADLIVKLAGGAA
ncbi:MAG: undecaprenyldiphospho-muramoylpentapeptide beta-N-acetylglucosaminyltransferase [Acidobacteriota bacterium]|nr:MAG: undecaprenyldiphospho-muramoylpentapeptide beta-N-acetylglucosaminyltransferase [Acidobacteriota bacterium]